MSSEWTPLNSVVEGDENANPDFPWYPCLFVDDGAFICTGLNVFFPSEEECRQFIKEYVLGARLEEEEVPGDGRGWK